MLLRKLKAGGELQLATNNPAYFTEALVYASDFWGLELKTQRSFQKSTLPHAQARTHFEKKYLARGETCFDVTFVKR